MPTQSPPSVTMKRPAKDVVYLEGPGEPRHALAGVHRLCVPGRDQERKNIGRPAHQAQHSI